MTLDPTLQLFFDEAADLLRDFEEGLLQLEQAPTDPEVLNRIFRSAHTLKGNSGMLGFDAIAQFTHVLEDLLMRLRAGELVVTRPIMDSLLAAADVLRLLVERARDGDETEVERLEETLKTLQAHASRAPTAPHHRAPEASASPSVYTIRFAPPPDLLRRRLDPLRIVESLEELGGLVRVEPGLDSLPPLGELNPETAYLSFTCWLRSREPRERIEAHFEFVNDPAAVRVEACPDAPPVAEEKGDGTPAGLEAGGRRDQSVPGPGRPTGTERRAGAQEQRLTEPTTIRVATEKVDRLINLVGELVITQSIVAQVVAGFTPERLGQLQEAVAQMDRHARELQERVMAVRMLPIRTLFRRFPRLVRDLAQAQGKEVLLVSRGEETELDKSVIEQIVDPLTHLVRNAVDHGVEPPEARRRMGKPEVGRLSLKAYQQGGNIYIEVADDGAGLDRERILTKAAEAGLLAPDEPLPATDEQVFALIFRPGLSTAEAVTEVSGRGVGMDVVRRNVEAVGGSITIQSEPGQGTTFRIKLPLTLAILDGQTLEVGGEVYILPLVSILESVQPSRGGVHRVLGQGEAVTIRNQIIPLLRLHRLFSVRPRNEDPTRGLVVIAEHEGRKVALLVDELGGQQQVVIKSLESNFQKVPGVAGATILGDGRVALILDVPGLVALARTGPLRAVA
jgi:two-component system chemotaxis sensor kinase CheA